MQLEGKKILLAVSGSIAAYKTPDLVRKLIKAGAEVKVIMTPSAANFVAPLSLATVSKNEVWSSVSEGSEWNNHVALGRWADVMLIAPCSANTLAKLANGLCDNLLCAVYLSATCPIVVAPAMDEDMWHHPTSKSNIQRIQGYGNHIIPVGHGELASGLVGDGRMAEVEDIVLYINAFLSSKENKPLLGKKAIVTAGPTYEQIDPVRFIGNNATGKMGIAIAEVLAENGAEVILILGPTHLRTQNNGVKTINVYSADEMYEQAIAHFSDCQIAVMAAAVADYKPATIATDKIKKKEDTLEILLVKNKDILATLGSMKKEDQTLVGFALETNNEEQNALEKLKRKNADFIVLNSLNTPGAGFGYDTNQVTILSKKGEKFVSELLPKKEIAKTIVTHIINHV